MQVLQNTGEQRIENTHLSGLQAQTFREVAGKQASRFDSMQFDQQRLGCVFGDAALNGDDI